MENRNEKYKGINPPPMSETIFWTLVSLRERPRHGYELMKIIETETEGRVRLAPGNLYNTLRRNLLHRGFISVAPEEELFDTNKGDRLMQDSERSPLRRRIVYRITEKGEQGLQKEGFRIDICLRAYERALKERADASL